MNVNTCDMSNSSRSSSSDNLVIDESVDNENVSVVIEDSLGTETISPVVNDLTATEYNLNNTNATIGDVVNIVNPIQNYAKLLLENDVPSVIKNSNEIQTIDNNNTKANTEVDNQIDPECEIIDYLSDSVTVYFDDLNDFINECLLIAKKSFPLLYKLYINKKLTTDQLDSILSQKATEILKEKGSSKIQERESYWEKKYSLLFHKVKTLQAAQACIKKSKPYITGLINLKPINYWELPYNDHIYLSYTGDDYDNDGYDDITIVKEQSTNQPSSKTVNKKTSEMNLLKNLLANNTLMQVPNYPTSTSSIVPVQTSDFPQQTTVLEQNTKNYVSRIASQHVAQVAHSSESLKSISTVPDITHQLLPPAPKVAACRKLTKSGSLAILLLWTMIPNNIMSKITSYEIFFYKEIRSVPPNEDLWNKICTVTALTLPMACTINNDFVFDERYHFAIRAVDIHNQVGPYSAPLCVILN